MSGYFRPADPPMHRWQGASGRWYYFTVYPISAIPSWIAGCNYIFARPRFDQANSREPLYIGEKGDTDRFTNHEKLTPALRLGATELHVHLSAKSRGERLDIETDLRHAHRTPLNAQPTPAPVNTLGALGEIFGYGGGLAPYGFSSGGGLLGALCRAAPPSTATLPYSYPFERSPSADLFEPGDSLAALSRALSKTR